MNRWMALLRFALRRLLVAVPTLLVVITVAFIMMRIAPGSPFESERKLPPQILRSVEASYGMDRPLIEQYVNYLGDVVRGELGPSLRYRGKEVADFIREGFPMSLKIGLFALLVAMGLGIAIGATAAIKQNSGLDHAATALSLVGICIPAFAVAPLLVLWFGSTLGWLPIAGTAEGFKSYILPVAVLALPHIAVITRLVRAGMVEVLRSEYVRTARSRGFSEATVVMRHAMRPALLPLIGYLGPGCAGLIAGSLVVEKIFNLPGLGRTFVLGALQRDYTVVMGLVILYAALILLLNLVAELLQAWFDPRVRLS